MSSVLIGEQSVGRIAAMPSLIADDAAESKRRLSCDDRSMPMVNYPTDEDSVELKDDLERYHDDAAAPVEIGSTADEKDARSFLRHCCESMESRMIELQAGVSHDWTTATYHGDSSSVAVYQWVDKEMLPFRSSIFLI